MIHAYVKTRNYAHVGEYLKLYLTFVARHLRHLKEKVSTGRTTAYFVTGSCIYTKLG